jgi:O-antigen/teichoic acid export membrane protein
LSLIKKLAKQTAIYGLSTIVGRALNYLLVPLYTRVFLPAEYGVVTELYAFVGFFTVLFTYGMETAFFRYAEKSEKPNEVFGTAFLSILFTTIIFSGVIILSSTPIAGYFNNEAHSEYILWFGLVLGLDALTAIPFAQLRRENKAMNFALVKLTNIGINIGLNLFFLVLCPILVTNGNPWVNSIYNAEIGVGYVFIANLAASGITLLLLFPQIIKQQLQFNFLLWKEMVGYALPLLVVGFAGIINEMLDRVLLRKLLPYSQTENLRLLGIYGANYKLSILISLFTQAYRYAAEPVFFAQVNKENAKQLYADMMLYFVLAQCVFFLGIMLHLDYLKYFIGAAYWEGLSIVSVLLLANIALGVYYNLSVWYKLTDKTNLGAYIALFGAAVTIVFNVMLIPTLGYMGSAWATLICYVVMVFISWYYGEKYYPVDYPWKKMGLWLGIAIGLFSISNAVSFLSEQVALIRILNSALFIVYILALWQFEIKSRKTN